MAQQDRASNDIARDSPSLAYREELMFYSIKIQAVLIIILLVLGISSNAVAGDEPAVKPYNHILKRSTLNIQHGDEVQIREILFAPGWKAPRHYHNSDLFIYVISGEFEVDMEGEDLKTYTGGAALRMMPNTPMDARNASEVKPLKLAVFQVGAPDAPFVVPVDP
jgi:quercetin dioxygenase-like cupin family protein